MRPTRLCYANLSVYAVTAILALSFATELRWAARGLPNYILGGAPPLLEGDLFDQAAMGMKQGSDPGWIRARLRQAIQIDPNSMANVALGEQYRRDGKPGLALEHLAHYLELDPSDLYAYLRIAEIHQAEGRQEERRQIIEQGLAFFMSHLEQQRPHFDSAVEPRFNDKAASVYRKYQNSLRVLRTLL